MIAFRRDTRHRESLAVKFEIITALLLIQTDDLVSSFFCHIVEILFKKDTLPLRPQLSKTELKELRWPHHPFERLD